VFSGKPTNRGDELEAGRLADDQALRLARENESGSEQQTDRDRRRAVNDRTIRGS
jgi:hypothetical protein